MRSDKFKKWLDHKGEKLPVRGHSTEDYSDLTIEDWVVIEAIRDMWDKPNGALLNAIMGQRYGQLKAGDGAELSSDSESGFNASFGTVIDDRDE